MQKPTRRGSQQQKKKQQQQQPHQPQQQQQADIKSQRSSLVTEQSALSAHDSANREQQTMAAARARVTSLPNRKRLSMRTPHIRRLYHPQCLGCPRCFLWCFLSYRSCQSQSHEVLTAAERRHRHVNLPAAWVWRESCTVLDQQTLTNPFVDQLVGPIVPLPQANHSFPPDACYHPIKQPTVCQSGCRSQGKQLRPQRGGYYSWAGNA